LLVLRHDTLKLIDGAGPTTLAQDQNKAEEPGVNGKEPERQTVPENEQRDPSQQLEQAKEPVQTSTSPKCPFSRTVLPIDLKRFTASSVSSVECPLCGRTRSLSPVVNFGIRWLMATSDTPLKKGISEGRIQSTKAPEADWHVRCRLISC